MKRRTKWIAALCAAAVAVGAGAFAAKSVCAPLSVECYLYDPCGGCGGQAGPCKPCAAEQGYRSKYAGLIDDAGLGGAVDFELYNTLYPLYSDQLRERLGTPSPPEGAAMPIAFVGGEVLYGDDAITAGLEGAIRRNTTLAARVGRLFGVRPEERAGGEKTVGTILYFSMDGCPDCVESDAYLQRRDEELGGRLLEQFTVIKLGEGTPPQNKELMQRMYELYGRGDEDLWVPTVFVGDRCLIDCDEITAFFDGYDPSGTPETRVPDDYESFAVSEDSDV